MLEATARGAIEVLEVTARGYCSSSTSMSTHIQQNAHAFTHT